MITVEMCPATYRGAKCRKHEGHEGAHRGDGWIWDRNLRNVQTETGVTPPNLTCHACRAQVPHDHRGPCPKCNAEPENIWL